MARHTYFYICPLCGCNLDPNEKCTCEQEQEEKERSADNGEQKRRADYIRIAS